MSGSTAAAVVGGSGASPEQPSANTIDSRVTAYPDRIRLDLPGDPAHWTGTESIRAHPLAEAPSPRARTVSTHLRRRLSSGCSDSTIRGVTQSRKIHYLNADFDLRLRARARWKGKSSLRRQVRELSWQGVLGASEGDVVYTPEAPPGEFIEHLREVGLAHASVSSQFDASWSGEFAPYGWSDEAIELNRRLANPVRHPAFETVRRVNSRGFALDLERSLGVESSSGAMVRSVVELERRLEASPVGSGWIVKGQHGNSGLANRRLRGASLTDADRSFVARCLEDDDALLVERRHDRVRDWCVVFDVPFERASARIHETVCTTDGALIGALFDREVEVPGALYETAEGVAARLDGARYFGPACIDAYHWRDGDRLRLREIADVNCRLSMSSAAFRARQRLAPRQVLYYRFFNRGKLDLPETISGATAALGEHRFEPATRRGILFTSPLDGLKLSAMFVESDRERVFALERWFRGRFER